MPRLAATLVALLGTTAGVACGGSSNSAGPAGSNHGNDGGSPGKEAGLSDAQSIDSAATSDANTPPADSSDSHDTAASPSDGRSDDAPGAGDAGALVVPAQVPAGWNLALDDEFEGSTLGPSWSVGTNLTSFVDNGTTYWNPYQKQEAEYLTASMVAVQSSNLILSTEASAAVTGPYGAKTYIAGYVTSYGKFDFQYGYAEFRMEMPDVAAGSQTGLWPALWLLNSTYANSDEIDVLESYGADQTAIQMTAQPNNSANATITPGYHVLGVLHTASMITFYVDNQVVKAFNQAMSSKMAILMGMQLGSAAFGWLPGPMPANWPGGINGPMTADFKVDWVHVWTP